MKLAEVLRQQAAQLATAHIESATLDTRLLISHALGLDRTGLLSQSQRELTSVEIAAIEKLIARRAAHEPVARIIGEREFWSLPFGINEATLEPRPDSEVLVEVTLQRLKPINTPRLLDLGTGTGCLLLALLYELPEATGLGIDKKFDAIISNPPYIPSSTIAELMPEVRNHDPLLALDGGDDGLAAYKILAPRLGGFLKPGGLAICEVGIGQADDVAALFMATGFSDIAKYKDLNGIERCVVAKRQR